MRVNWHVISPTRSAVALRVYRCCSAVVMVSVIILQPRSVLMSQAKTRVRNYLISNHYVTELFHFIVGHKVNHIDV